MRRVSEDVLDLFINNRINQEEVRTDQVVQDERNVLQI
jgi:hypothetical protein